MDKAKYIGMDVHKEAISVAVLNSSGKLVMECTIETKASTILDFLKGLRGSLHVTFEEGTWAAWLYDLIKPHVTELVVCNPRRNALLKEGSKSDRIDARKLAELLRSNMVRSVYHGENGVRTLRELARSYLTISTDLIRVMTRVKAIYRSWGIPLQRETGLRRTLSSRVARQDPGGRRASPGGVLLPAVRCIAGAAPTSAARTAHRSAEHERLKFSAISVPFARSARRFFSLCCKHRIVSVPSGSSGATADLPSRRTAAPSSAFVQGELQRSKRPASLRALNRNHNHELKNLFKGAATLAAAKPGPFQEFYATFGGQGNPAGNGAADFGAKMPPSPYSSGRKECASTPNI